MSDTVKAFDDFAGRAMSALIAKYYLDGKHDFMADISAAACGFASAMMQERAKHIALLPDDAEVQAAKWVAAHPEGEGPKR